MFDKWTYLDNAATTRLDERVLEAMKPYLFETYAVATSQFGYSMGIDAREALDKARVYLQGRLGAAEEEIVFTSGNTESSNMALKGVALALQKKKGKHIVVSKIEDFPVLNSAKALEMQGFSVSYLDVDKEGLIDLEQVEVGHPGGHHLGVGATCQPRDRHGAGHQGHRRNLSRSEGPVPH